MGSERRREMQDAATRPLGTWRMIALTVGMSSTQLLWSVQNAYGTPYMNSLGIPAEYTALIWLASPLAGLIVQPTIGPLSDETSGRFRRRSWIVSSTLVTYVAMLYVSWAPDFLSAFVVSNAASKALTISIAVVFLWIANFSLNVMQATVRDLLLDQAPASQQPRANAWVTRFSDVAGVLGYLAGYFRLSSWSALDWMNSTAAGSGTQFRKLSFVASTAAAVLVVLLCLTQHERRNEPVKGERETWRRLWRDLKESLGGLPLPVRRVCYVQVLAWVGYNALLVYSSSYVASLVYATNPSTTTDDSTRAGSLGLVFYSLIALVSSILFPLLCSLGARQSVLARLPRSRSSAVRRLLAGVTPRNVWTAGLVVFAAAMAGTFAVQTVGQAQAAVAVTGVSWAVGEWVPYALVLEAVRELEQESTAALSTSRADPAAPFTSSPNPTTAHSLTHSSLSSSSPLTAARPGGSLLGIHATSIVIAKIILSSCASCIFKVVSAFSSSVDENVTRAGAPWVLRFGGLAALTAAVASRWAVEPTSERVYRERLCGGTKTGGEGKVRALRRVRESEQDRGQ
ncbi:hypothetical protein JCM10207_000796 [Rhodosporidiobolus poonsookiae]